MEETKPKKDQVEDEGAPVCEKCGCLLIQEEGEFVCPDCAGEIDFFGEEDEPAK